MKKSIFASVIVVCASIANYGCSANQVDSNVEISFSEAPIPGQSQQDYSLTIVESNFSAGVIDKELLPWWENEEYAFKFMKEYHKDYLFSFYLEKNDLSEDTSGSFSSYDQDNSVIEYAPYLPYEDSGDKIKAVAIYNPNTMVGGLGTGNLSHSLSFPVVSVEIPKDEDNFYLILDEKTPE